LTVSRLEVVVAGISPQRQRELSEMLTSLGYQPVWATEDQVLERAKTSALVLLGRNQISRVKIIEEIKNNSELAILPVFLVEEAPQESHSRIMTSPLQTLQFDTDIEVCFAVGADDYLVLPTRTTFLKQRLDIALERREFRAYKQNKGERDMLAKLERDVQIGRQIQASFLPSKLPQPEGWEIAASFHPAREVAGDFYDSFYVWNRRRVAFIVADVSDKGIPAALFMAIFRTLLRAGSLYGMKSIRTGSDMLSEPMEPIKAQQDWSEERPGQRPRKLPTIGLSQLESVPSTNSYMSNTHGIDAYFVTLFFGILDPRTGDLIYVNGGHNPPLVLRAGGGYDKLNPTGPAVGVIPEAKYRYAHTKLAPGDTLFAYTDGVPEGRNPQGEFFNEARMLAALEQPSSSAEAVLSNMENALQAFDAYSEQFDDITMMSVRYCNVDASTTAPKAETGAEDAEGDALNTSSKRFQRRSESS
jgi:sigma-B regulation protein RsbU (phosphoserine phosphatase)